MANLNLDYSEISSGCNEYLNTSIRKLNGIISDFEQLYISFGCNKREEIIRIKRGIIKQRDKLENIKSWIVNSSRDFSSSCEEGASRIARLPNVKFGKRR